MTQAFSLVVRGKMTDAVVEKLYERSPDLTISVDRDEMGGLVEVDREDQGLLDAVVGAIADVESVGDLTVIRVEPDELVYAAEIAERIGRSRASVDHIVKGLRGPGDFPAPATHAGGRNPLWRWSEVAQWFAIYEGREQAPEERERSSVLAAVNGALEARRFTQEMSRDERRRLLRLLA